MSDGGHPLLPESPLPLGAAHYAGVFPSWHPIPLLIPVDGSHAPAGLVEMW